MKNILWSKSYKVFRQQVTWPTLLGGGYTLDHVYLKVDMGNGHWGQPSTFLQWSLCGENLLLDEKKIFARSLAKRLKLSSFVMVLFVILKCRSNVSFDKFRTTVSSIEAISRIPGLFYKIRRVEQYKLQYNLKWLVSQNFIFCRVSPVSTRIFCYITCTFKRTSLRLFRFKISQCVPFLIEKLQKGDKL